MGCIWRLFEYTIKELKDAEEPLIEWKVKELANLNGNISDKVKERIKVNILG